MPDCVSIFLMKRENFVFIGFSGQFYTNLRVKYFILPKKILFDTLTHIYQSTKTNILRQVSKLLHNPFPNRKINCKNINVY